MYVRVYSLYVWYMYSMCMYVHILHICACSTVCTVCMCVWHIINYNTVCVNVRTYIYMYILVSMQLIGIPFRSISSRGLFSNTSEDSIGAVNGLAVFSSELTLVLPNLVGGVN